MNEIGFMQGRLSEIVDGKIQAFPWENWKNEFKIASEIGLRVLEWTLDYDRLYENPLMTIDGRDEIKSLMRQYNIKVNSLTGDCFMQAPFWKSGTEGRRDLKRDFLNVCESCSKVGISLIVVPLVDNGSIENAEQESQLTEFLYEIEGFLNSKRLLICFEIDYAPLEVSRFLRSLPSSITGINYDIGNSAALGYDPEEEFDNFGHKIFNVHVKDRKLGGGTVPLFAGSADFLTVFQLLKRYGYAGDYILQTARAKGADHTGVLMNYTNDIMGVIQNCQN